MKIFRVSAPVGGAILSILTLVSVRGNRTDTMQPASNAGQSLVTSTFAVEGMTCGGCAAAVELRVGRIEGVRSVDASHEEHTAVVTYDRARPFPDAIVEMIESLGYEAELVDAGGAEI